MHVSNKTQYCGTYLGPALATSIVVWTLIVVAFVVG